MDDTKHLDLIPSIALDTSIVGERHIFDAWRESVRGIYDVNPNDDERGVHERVRSYLVASLIFTEVTLSSQSFSRQSSHVKNAGDYLWLKVYKGGESRGISDDRSFVIMPGEVHIFDYTREFRSIITDSSVAGAVIPHEAVGYDPSRHPSYFMFPSASPIGCMLKQALYTVLDLAPNLQKEDASAVSDGFCSLLQSALCLSPLGNPETPNTFEARVHAMKAYLDKHLSDPDLGPERLSKEFGMSLPTVYRHFSETGGVNHYIVNRRLDRAYSQLASPSSRKRKIHEIANAAGYDDPAYFSRSFSKYFGIPPSSVQKLNQSREANGSDGRKFANTSIEDWLYNRKPQSHSIFSR
ncbi:helix-turn-helix domain-containing protein [Hoeflea sp. WL0058]|uniref:Helix-turn-helix domain-containing protein n=1 Tax=Flavimaribacter sediminis TaxID=2865987 RepID=A0AAE2ZTC5_9HYPH|nr:helix-turn-helix domain-containing protein [Flavimaribacter sediminis]MBW8640677.1 helix-turn-helix domain-containing protein [Flavimaribacter sediminis]